MSLQLHYHPLSSYCWKALIAFYEAGIAFEPRLLNLGDPDERAAFVKLWPLGKMPVLRDEGRDMTVPEAGAIIEYLDLRHGARLVPADAETAWRARLLERILDNHVHQPMQKIVGDKLRPADGKDPVGVDQARAQLVSAYGVIEREIGAGPWAVGEAFTLADCAAMPAIFYADKVQPLADGFPAVSAYLERLKARPSVARVLTEAEPYFAMFPG
jgi:glutathione S-transferase